MRKFLVYLFAALLVAALVKVFLLLDEVALAIVFTLVDVMVIIRYWWETRNA